MTSLGLFIQTLDSSSQSYRKKSTVFTRQVQLPLTNKQKSAPEIWPLHTASHSVYENYNAEYKNTE